MTKFRWRVLLVSSIATALILGALVWLLARQPGSRSASRHAVKIVSQKEDARAPAEDSRSTAAAPALTAGRSERVMPRDPVADQQHLCEFGLRRFAIDYGPFMEKSGLSRDVKDMLLRLLSEQFLSETDHEAREYDRMMAELLAEKYPEFTAYRERLPREQQAEAGLLALQSQGASVPLEVAATLRQGLTEIPVTNATYKVILAQQAISDADLDHARSEFLAAFDHSMTRLAPDGSGAYVQRLRDWYVSEGIEKQMKTLRIRQAMLAGKTNQR